MWTDREEGSDGLQSLCVSGSHSTVVDLVILSAV